jgi:hypothetical protein
MLKGINELIGWTITDVEPASRLEPVCRVFVTVTDGRAIRRVGLTARPLIASDVFVDETTNASK